MQNDDEVADQREPAERVTPKVSNPGEPLRFSEIEPWSGVALESAQPGELVKVCTRLAITSDEPLFHRLVESLELAICSISNKSGAFINIRRANTVLLIFREDKSAELWIDTAAVAMQCIVKRAVEAQSIVFDSDIADITAMTFPSIAIGDNDKVLCLFREGWSFALAFDFNTQEKFEASEFYRSLGTLYRTLHYRHLYDAVRNPLIFEPLLAMGWFPFVEIIGAEFRDLSAHVSAGFNTDDIVPNVISAFNEDRLNHLFARWMTKPHFAAKQVLLKEAIDAFVAGKPASVIKIVLTEIEGVLNDAYKAVNGGRGAKLKRLLSFAQASAEQRAGGSDTLLFSASFARESVI